MNTLQFQRIAPTLWMAMIVTAILAISQNLTISLISVAWFILHTMRRTQFEITHPAVWLPPFIFVYHYNIIILHLLEYEHLARPFAIIWIGWIAITVSTVLFVALGREHNRNHDDTPRPFFLSALTIRTGYGVTLLMLLYTCRKYFSLGYTNKTQFYIAQSLPELDYVPVWFMIFFALWIVQRQQEDGHFSWTLTAVTGTLTLLCTLVLGERDIFLSFCAVTIFLVYYFYRPGKMLLAMLGVLIAGPLLSLLHTARNIFSNDISSMEAFGEQGMWLSFLYGEFIAGGRNLDILLTNQQWWSPFYGVTPLWVLWHKFFPGVLVEARNSLIWFHENFLPDWTTLVGGYGFTFSGDGYINCGLVGVVLWYAVLAGIIVWLYNRSSRGGSSLVVYAVSAPLVVFALRSTMLYIPGAAMLILKPLIMAYVVEILGRYVQSATQSSEIRLLISHESGNGKP